MAFHTNAGLAEIGLIDLEIFDLSVNAGAVQQSIRSGLTTSQFHGVLNAEPLITFQTYDVGKVLANLSLLGNNLATNNLVVWTNVATAAGAYTGTANKCTVTAGTLCVTNISSTHGSPATATLAAYPVSSDGMTDPLTWGTGTLPTITETQVIYNLGTGTFNGSSIGQITNVNIDFGHDVMRPGHDGHTWASFAGIRTYEPVFTVSTSDVIAVRSVIGNTGTQGDGTNGLIVNFRATSSGVNGANAVGLKAKRGQAIMGDMPFSTGGTANTSFIYTASLQDGDSGAPITVV